MEPNELLAHYTSSDLIKTIAHSLTRKKTVRIKGLAGSFDALLAAATSSIHGQTAIYVLHDKEEAAYFLNDLQNFLPQESLMMFPGSYKKPYQFEETENANVLQRAEVLNQINSQKSKGLQIITYPDALYEKVINKRSLLENTFKATVGEKLDVEFLSELLTSYDFERTDFVYEAGQFSVRGGIIDVFSFAHDYPYRLELFGDEIESIREFDPESQLSTTSLEEVTLIPNVQTKLLKEERQSFFEFIPDDTIVWLKDYRETLDLIEKGFNKAEESFGEIMRVSGFTQVVLKPTDLFDSEQSFDKLLKKFNRVEFGNRYYLKPEEEFQLEIKPQPHFHKNFELLAQDLYQFQVQDFLRIITAESFKQLERLETIFEEINHDLRFDGIGASLKEGFIDNHHEVVCYTDHQIFDRFHQYKAKEKFSKSKSLTLRELKTLQPGDYVVHIDYGVGRFAGLDTVDVGGNKQEALRLIYRDDDLLYVSIHSLHKVSKYSSKESTPPAINKLGTQDWENKKKKVKRKVKDIAKDLINLYAKRKAAPGYAFPEDNYLQAELESSFLYQDTPDQASATQDVKKDMELNHPMDRLVCGDVGFGKTEIAVRAAFKAVNSGKQVAVLVPTTILAMQHYHTFSKRLEDLPVTVDYINRFKSAKEITEVKKGVKSGKIDILIGTHRIVNKDIEFKELGLMIIDEEQKFGVKVKERLKEMRVNVDALTLTATPIPRTLHFSLMGARDLSIISTPPPNRRPVTTEIHEFNEEVIRDAVSHEIRRGGQVFFVHNRISDIEHVGNIIFRLVPDARICIAHGQMDGKQLEKIMLKFIEGEYDVLVSTNIIESGLDIPNANTIIINRAHMFGLSDLHQMRGRVGRSNTKAYCYLITPPASGLSSDARKRLTTLEEFSDLGDGFKVAMRDLDIRGAGNLLGSEQSGFINDMGFEVYHKILDEAVTELKETEFKELFEDQTDTKMLQGIKEDCTIETDMEILIPENYVSNISERLNLYSKMDSLQTEPELAEFVESMKDRFGPLPEPVENLITSVRVRWAAIALGFEKVSIKNEIMKCYLSEKRDESYFQSELFGAVLQYVQSMPRRCKMREHRKKLIISIKEITDINEALQVMDQMKTPVSA
ncbi:transcription-repair coupling factor [Marinoscillum furvescens]|uniref:Transcription-repair-coupling factor n=1 Tax=Marinoscillum furvescens DSM 4134 TaxID=1122208 RepID=A0A3D9L198_MARFU|nr:transcription-repair coupling factor [Marinoscillum furvescens]RED94146.1 transcription-repair coupling factor (superfamily II helicase) [Marinoscillum furvescens DSM 4134]